LSGLACFWGAGALSWRALAAEARYLLGDRADLPLVPLKIVSAFLTAAGAGLAAAAGGHAFSGAAAFAALGAAGYLCFYGLDMRAPKVSVTPVAGVDVPGVTQQIEQASQRLRRIEAAARTINVPELNARLARITSIGRDVLREIARDPRHAPRARRFLHTYLEGAERVTEEYARTHARARNQSLDEDFRQLLIDMESTFAQQHHKLLDNDVMSLDAEIEVLNTRLARERQAIPVETRR
jgi:hypothetical protein